MTIARRHPFSPSVGRRPESRGVSRLHFVTLDMNGSRMELNQPEPVNDAGLRPTPKQTFVGLVGLVLATSLFVASAQASEGPAPSPETTDASDAGPHLAGTQTWAMVASGASLLLGLLLYWVGCRSSQVMLPRTRQRGRSLRNA